MEQLLYFTNMVSTLTVLPSSDLHLHLETLLTHQGPKTPAFEYIIVISPHSHEVLIILLILLEAPKCVPWKLLLVVSKCRESNVHHSCCSITVLCILQWEQHAVLSGHTSAVNAVAAIGVQDENKPERTVVVTASADSTVKIWNRNRKGGKLEKCWTVHILVESQILCSLTQVDQDNSTTQSGNSPFILGLCSNWLLRGLYTVCCVSMNGAF